MATLLTASNDNRPVHPVVVLTAGQSCNVTPTHAPTQNYRVGVDPLPPSPQASRISGEGHGAREFTWSDLLVDMH